MNKVYQMSTYVKNRKRRFSAVPKFDVAAMCRCKYITVVTIPASLIELIG